MPALHTKEATVKLDLFGIPYRGEIHDIEWYTNPHEAVKRAEELDRRKIIWLVHDSDIGHPYHGNRNSWQTVFNLREFRRRVLTGFAPPDSKVWQDSN